MDHLCECYERFWASPTHKRDRCIENGILREHGLHQRFNPCGIGVCPHPAGHSVPFHKHDYYELVYVHQGVCFNLIDNRRIRLQAGDLCLMNQEAYHTLQCPSPDGTIIFNILIGSAVLESSHFQLLSYNDFVSNFFLHRMEQQQRQSNCIIFSDPTKESSAVSFCQQIILEHYDHIGMPYQHSMLIFLFDCLLVTLIRMYQEEHNTVIGKKPSGERITDVILYLSEHCRTVTLASAAKQFSYHPKYFSRLLQKVTGQSFSELLLSIRMQQAISLLKNSDLPITDIMHQIGYQNYTSFTNQFQHIYGISPSEVRKNTQIP